MGEKQMHLEQETNSILKDWRKIVLRTTEEDCWVIIERDQTGTTTRFSSGAEVEKDVPARIRNSPRGTGFTALSESLLSEAGIIAESNNVSLSDPIEFFVTVRGSLTRRRITDYDTQL
jgi:hypothetical protein